MKKDRPHLALDRPELTGEFFHAPGLPLISTVSSAIRFSRPTCFGTLQKGWLDMLGGAGNDVLEPVHEALLAKMPLAHVGNHRLPVGSETGFGVAFLGLLDRIDPFSLFQAHGTPLILIRFTSFPKFLSVIPG